MPIYEYRCDKCGHQEDHLQKISEPVLTTCPSCGKKAYKKLLSAAGFQLKGSGWYATDFKSTSKKAADKTAQAEAKPDAKAETKTEAKSETKTESKPAAKPAVTTD
jgi:putative FmdB family regulatory protein